MRHSWILSLLFCCAAVAGASGESRLKHVDVFISGKDGYAGYRIPAIETAQDGSLLAFAEARKYNLADPGEKGQEIDLVLKRSTDGGATWSAMRVIEHAGKFWSSANPATVVDRRTGRVWVFYIRCKPGRSTDTARPGTNDVANLARCSDDNGATWSEPIDQTGVARDMAAPQWRISVPGPGGAIQDRKGRLIVPMWRFAPWGAFAIFSEDHGRTWQHGACVSGKQGGDEDQLVELADGRILLDVRQQGGPNRWTATSGDGGRTWSAARPGQIVDPVCCAIERYTLKTAGDDRDRIVWTGPKGPGRNKLVVRTSYDEGRTFTNERLISDEPAAYSDLTVLKDKSIGVFWERGNYKSLTFTRLTREFLEPPSFVYVCRDAGAGGYQAFPDPFANSDGSVAQAGSNVVKSSLATAATTSTALAAAPEKAAGPFVSIDPALVKMGGEMGRRIGLTIQKNLLAIEVENQFLDAFRRKQSPPMDYIGLGKLIDATVSFARYSKDPKVIELKDRLVKELIATQLGDGYLGTFPAGSRIRELFDEHEMAYNIHALVNNYRYFHDKRSLDAARKLANYILKNYKSAVLTRDPAKVCKIDIERAMIALSEATGDAQYRDYIVDRVDLRRWNAPIDVRNTGVWSSADGHAYTFMNMCLAQLDLCREQPNEVLLAQSRRVIDYLTKDDGLMITGTCSLEERFRNNQETRGAVGESCATAYLIRMTHYLLQLEGRTLNGDIMERAIYNALFAAQSPDGRKLRYFTSIDGPRVFFDKDTYCCPGNWRRIVAELPEMAYYRSADGGVLVNLYTTSAAEVRISGALSVHLRQETDYPNSGKVAITVEPSRHAEFPVMLRIPGWCKTATVSVNGQPAGIPAHPGEWYSLKRLWKAGDVVTLEMPMKTRLVRGRKLQAGKVAVMRGPLVFCFSPARQASRYPVYVGHGTNPAEIQRTVAESVGQTKFDWTTLAAPVPDQTIRPEGLALEVRGWGPASDRNKPADLTLLLTEYIDPTGELVYLPADNPQAGVEDELCAVPPAR